MKLHEMKQKRNTIAKDMRALHEKIGDNAWTDERKRQRSTVLTLIYW